MVDRISRRKCVNMTIDQAMELQLDEGPIKEEESH